MAIIKDESWKSFSVKILYNDEEFEKVIVEDEDPYHYMGVLYLHYGMAQKLLYLPYYQGYDIDLLMDQEKHM